jgi:hypothetical protein
LKMILDSGGTKIKYINKIWKLYCEKNYKQWKYKILFFYTSL